MECWPCTFVWQAFAGKDLEEQLRSVSSVDELMSVLYPDYWKMYKCQLRKGGWQQPTLNTRTGDNVKFAAAHYNTEILKSKYKQQVQEEPQEFNSDDHSVNLCFQLNMFEAQTSIKKIEMNKITLSKTLWEFFLCS